MKRTGLLILLGCLSLPAAAVGEINVNKASADTLMSRLDGVDRTLAERIISYRDKHGPFVGLYELHFVDGVDRAFFLSNYDRMTVGKVSLADKPNPPFSG